MSDAPLPPSPVPAPSSRTYSKGLIAANTAAAWAAVFTAMFVAQGTLGIVVPAMTGVVWAIFATYAGIGHMDLRQIVKAMPETPAAPSADDDRHAPGDCAPR